MAIYVCSSVLSNQTSPRRLCGFEYCHDQVISSRVNQARRQLDRWLYPTANQREDELARMSNCNSVFSMTVGCAEDVLK
jgi:hypothetical protein